MKNRLAKSFAAIFFALLVASIGAAQETCELNSKTAPLVLNLRVGMSPEQAQAVVGKDLKIKIKKRGERTFFQNFIRNPAPGRLRGVRALYLRFFNARLYQIEIFYEPRPDLNSLENIAAALASQFAFSPADWKIENNLARIVCGETALAADNVLNPRIELTDETLRAEIEKLREKDK